MPQLPVGDMRTALPPPHLFAGLDEKATAAILARMSRRRFAAEQHLCRQGDPGDSLYLITDGLVDIWLEQENGRLKKMVADRDLEIDVLKEITRKKW